MRLAFTLTILALTGLAALPASARQKDDGTTTIQIRIGQTDEKKKGQDQQKTQEEKTDKKKKHSKKSQRDATKNSDDSDDDDEKEVGWWKHQPQFRLLTGTYNPSNDTLIGGRSAFGNLRQYSLATGGHFIDYLQGKGPIKTDIIGVGNQSKFTSSRGPVSPFIGWGWGLYHARTDGGPGAPAGFNTSQTRFAWKLRLGVDVPFGTIELQTIDARFKNGLRGTSLLFGLRY
jgi:hypothetical protein